MGLNDVALKNLKRVWREYISVFIDLKSLGRRKTCSLVHWYKFNSIFEYLSHLDVVETRLRACHLLLLRLKLIRVSDYPFITNGYLLLLTSDLLKFVLDRHLNSGRPVELEWLWLYVSRVKPDCTTSLLLLLIWLNDLDLLLNNVVLLFQSRVFIFRNFWLSDVLWVVLMKRLA